MGVLWVHISFNPRCSTRSPSLTSPTGCQLPTPRSRPVSLLVLHPGELQGHGKAQPCWGEPQAGLMGLPQKAQAAQEPPLQCKVPSLQRRGTGEGARALLAIQPQTLLMTPSLPKGLPTTPAVSPPASRAPQSQEEMGGSQPLCGVSQSHPEHRPCSAREQRRSSPHQWCSGMLPGHPVPARKSSE